MKFPTMEEFAKSVAEKALDEYEYKGKTLRQWIEFILATDTNVATKLSTNLAEVGREAITKQQAIDALRKLREEDIEDYGCEIPEGFNQDHLDRATFAIKQLPPIQPEIVRCKDCKHWKDSDGVFRRGTGAESKCPLNLHQVYEGTFFCGLAERREVTT